MMRKSTFFKIPQRPTRILQKLGALNHANLYWSFYEPRNFGDWISPYLYEAITGKTPVYYEPNLAAWSSGVFSTGSILRKIRKPDTAIVWGSGIISKDDQFAEPRAVLAVRGPQSRDHLHRLCYPSTEVFGDPAILMPTFFFPSVEKNYRVGVIPHYFDYDRVRSVFAAQPEVLVIDVCQDVETVIKNIVSCEATVSSSLHGIILSQSYKVPCAWISSGVQLMGDGIKFLDYFEAGQAFGVQPRTLVDNESVLAMEKMAREAPVPSLDPLIRPLLDICPFRV